MLRVAIINDTQPGNHFGCLLVMENLRELLEKNAVEVLWTWPVSVDWRNHKRKLREFPKVDAFIINGEGTIHHSASRKYARALTEFPEFAEKELHTPSYLINATLHSNNAEAYEGLRRFEKIFVRDKSSLAELKRNQLFGRYVPDLTLAKAVFGRPVSGNKICVIDSAVKSDRIFLKQLATQRSFEFRSMVVARPGNVSFFRSPRPFVKNYIQWLRGDWQVSIDPKDFVRYLQKHSLVITGRYHAVTMCIKHRIPFVAVESNTPKITSLLTDALGGASRVKSHDEINGLDFVEWNEYSSDEMRSLDIFLEKVEVKIDDMIRALVKSIRG